MATLPDTLPYYSPWVIPDQIDLASSGVNKPFRFAFSIDVIPEAKIVFSYQGVVVRTYEVGSGIELEGSPVEAVLTVSGADFPAHAGKRLDAACTFFNVGDVDVVFTLTIVKTLV